MDRNLVSFDNQYIIGDETLGEGAFGRVVKGTDILNKKFIACKIVEIKKLKKNPKIEFLFDQEIKLQKKMDSPFTLKLHKVYNDSENYYVILDFCDSGNLHEHVKEKGPLPEKEAIGFLLQILAGFREIHSKSIIHRDLKPANILIDNGKQLKIADFGASRIIEAGDEGETTIGTPQFLAPEIYEGSAYGFEVDIFSLGILLYFMLYNDFPFKGQNGYQIQKSIKETKSIDFCKNNVFISRLMQDFLNRLLKYNRDERISWSEIYKHPIITNSMKSDYVSAEIIIAPSSSDIQMYMDPKFSNQKGGSIQSISNLSAIEIVQQQPRQANQQNQAEKEKQDQQIKLQQIIAEEFVLGVQKYVHKRNVYGVLFTLVDSFKQYSHLEINHEITAFLAYKKLRSLNNELLNNVNQNKNIFNMKYFDQFIASDIYQKVKKMVQDDNEYIEQQIQVAQEEAIKSYNKLHLNNYSLNQQLNTKDLLNDFKNNFIGSIFSYGEGLQKQMKKTKDSDELANLFFQLILVYEVCCIDYQFEDKLDFDFEKHKNEVLQTNPEKYENLIQEYCAKATEELFKNL